MRPVARCCDFDQTYGYALQCRYLQSTELLGDNGLSSDSAASSKNEYTFITCNDQFPLMLGCQTKTTRDTDYDTDWNEDAISFYGSFYAQNSIPDGEYNPDYNGYFNIFEREPWDIPYDPSSLTPDPTPEPIDGGTSAPFLSPTPVPTVPTGSVYDEMDIVHSDAYTRCVAQRGPESLDSNGYTVTAVATCCNLDIYDDVGMLDEPTAMPTEEPTAERTFYTEYYGENGTNPGTAFSEGASSR